MSKPEGRANHPVPAATVVLVRDGRDGMETLMLRRNSRGAFGGMWVFPGGQVDPSDVDRAISEARARPPERFETHVATFDGGLVALWHGDAAYDDGDVVRPGPRHRLWMRPDGWRYESTL